MTAPDKLHYEDFSEGRRFELGPRTVTADEIIAFASEFDPQPMHLSEEAGKASILGGLSASGWHTSSLFMRMMIDAYVLNTASEGAPGIEFMQWRKPVLAGDTLSGQSVVEEVRLMRSRPHLGIVTFGHEIHNQRGELVMKARNAVMVRRRETAEVLA
ncbi:enoyl-CoA hydratase [Rhizobium sp. Root274]|uniref:MaoC family dehydratase n=1 Tax=unclassified Rhizobium TaxID=2613769 RepID=UPI000713FBFD|nr:MULTISPECIES: MaoC family dehydratase [unclassified Rhizobium]KQW28982.1 enoyl-CoA hydratase [Rhizobium sp. Root1240]KRD29178.1 enoyl-CoA hydratase [Rhizobium sp. Root274]